MPASKNVMFLVSVTYTGYSDTVHSLLLTVELFFVPQLTFLVTFLQIPNANGVAVSVSYCRCGKKTQDLSPSRNKLRFGIYRPSTQKLKPPNTRRIRSSATLPFLAAHESMMR